MITKRHQIKVRGIPVDVVRKDIKNLHLAVYPPRGRVRVAVPLRLDDQAVRLAVISRLSWIRRRQAGFDQQDRQFGIAQPLDMLGLTVGCPYAKAVALLVPLVAV